MLIPNRFLTVRTATCPTHNKATSIFVGPNTNGWVFRCPGWSEDDVKRLRREHPHELALQGEHLFCATPPEAQP